MYYRLTYRNSLCGHRVGESVLCSKRPLDIGQTSVCDIVLPESNDYESVVFATILPLEAGGWCIVRRTDCYEMTVNGSPLMSATKLSDGDIVTFSGYGITASFDFKILTDSDYDDATGVVYKKARTKPSWLLAIGIVVLAAICCVIVVVNNRGLRNSNIDRYDASIYHIVADSIILVKDTLVDGETREIVVEAAALEQPRSGTCFLTDDGRFVTARHCIEPWVADEDWDGVSTMTMPVDVRLAVLAETANRNAVLGMSDVHWRVKTHCLISGNGKNYEFFSDDFVIDRSRDLVMQLGDDKNPLWFRTIIPVANRRNMELGDWAYVEAEGMKGLFTLANAEEMAKFDKESNREIAVLGYPVKDNSDGDVVSHTFGNSQHVITPANAGCIEMSASVNPGNSGGPVIALIGNSIKVVGIVSKADAHATQGTFWAIPATELDCSNNRGRGHLSTNENEADEGLIYRR